jgi:hypothetical protein
MSDIIAATGLTEYKYQMTSAEQEAGDRGLVRFYADKDLRDRVPQKDRILPSDVVTMVDVDYYLSEDQWRKLLASRRPVLMYTVVPQSAGGDMDGAPFCFEGNDFVYTPSAGSNYRHRLWNWSIDCFSFTRRGLLFDTTTAWRVDVRHTTEHRAIVLLTPGGLISRPRWGLCGSVPLVTHSLERITVADGSFSRLKIVTEEGMKVSTSKQGLCYSATVTQLADHTVSSMVERKNALGKQLATVCGIDEQRTHLLISYHSTATNTPVSIVHMPTRTLDFANRSILDPAVPMIHPWMRPVYNSGMIPTRSKAAEEASVDERVSAVASDVRSVSPKVRTYEDQFISKLLRGRTGIVHALDTVTAALPGAKRERAVKALAFAADTTRRVKAFLKSEPATKIRSQRIIANFSPGETANYARYVMGLEDLVKDEPWYAFAMDPSCVAMRVASVANGALSVLETDFSSMDGRISQAYRTFELKVLTKCFPNSPELVKLHASTYGREMVLPSGTVYQQGTARGSGERGTSVLNTLHTALIAFIAYREDGLEPDEAYRKLGIFGGDDGLTAEVSLAAFKRAATYYGQKATGVSKMAGSVGLSFLSRLYTGEVWRGDPNSCADPERALGKFHLSSRQGIPLWEMAKQRALGYLYSDQNTPFLGDLVTQLWQRCQTETPDGGDLDPHSDPHEIRSWMARTKLSLHNRPEARYPNTVPDDLAALCCERLGVEDRSHWVAWLETREPLAEWVASIPTLGLTTPEIKSKEGMVDGETPVSDTEGSPPSEAAKPMETAATEQTSLQKNGTSKSATRGGGRRARSCSDAARPGGSSLRGGTVDKSSDRPRGPSNSRSSGGDHAADELLLATCAPKPPSEPAPKEQQSKAVSKRRARPQRRGGGASTGNDKPQ